MLSVDLLSYLDHHMLDDARCKVQHVKPGELKNYSKEPGITLVVCYNQNSMSEAMWELKTNLEITQQTFRLALNKGKIFTGTGLFWFIPAAISITRIQGLRFTRVLEYD